MRPEVHPFKINVPLDLMEKLKEAASRESRSLSAQMNLMLRRQIEREAADQK